MSALNISQSNSLTCYLEKGKRYYGAVTEPLIIADCPRIPHYSPREPKDSRVGVESGLRKCKHLLSVACSPDTPQSHADWQIAVHVVGMGAGKS